MKDKKLVNKNTKPKNKDRNIKKSKHVKKIIYGG